MKVLELFAGTRSIGKAFEARGHEVFSVDWDKKFENINLYADIGTVTADRIFELFGHPDVVWMSPDCTSYSIAGLRAHRKKNKTSGELEPLSDYAKLCDKVNSHCIDLLNDIKPTLWFIENPGGVYEQWILCNPCRDTLSRIASTLRTYLSPQGR